MALTGGLLGLAAAPSLAEPYRSVPPERTLRWSGTARAAVGGRDLLLRAETEMRLPLLRVRSTSWIASEGPAAARTLVIEPDGAWVERDGRRRPLPPAIGIHERQQYAIYAWLYLLERRRPRPRPGPLALSAPPYPDIVFAIGPDGAPLSAELTVDAPEDGKPRVAEHVAFHGRMDSRGVRWPRRIEIAQDGRPYFTLDLDRFEVLP